MMATVTRASSTEAQEAEKADVLVQQIVDQFPRLTKDQRSEIGRILGRDLAPTGGRSKSH